MYIYIMHMYTCSRTAMYRSQVYTCISHTCTKIGIYRYHVCTQAASLQGVAFKYVCVYVYHVYMYVYTWYIYICTCRRTTGRRSRACVCICISCIHVRIYIRTYSICTHAAGLPGIALRYVHICGYYICMYVYIYTHVIHMCCSVLHQVCCSVLQCVAYIYTHVIHMCTQQDYRALPSSVWVCIHIKYACRYIHVCTLYYMRMQQERQALLAGTCVYTHVYYICVRIYISMYIRIYVCACTWIHMLIIYIYTCSRTSR